MCECMCMFSGLREVVRQAFIEAVKQKIKEKTGKDMK